jgi:hypothetical protein
MPFRARVLPDPKGPVITIAFVSNLMSSFYLVLNLQIA